MVAAHFEPPLAGTALKRNASLPLVLDRRTSTSSSPSLSAVRVALMARLPSCLMTMVQLEPGASRSRSALTSKPPPSSWSSRSTWNS